jgi:hypothetical protein
MTKYMFTWAIAALLFAGCGNSKTNEHSHGGDAHEHHEGLLMKIMMRRTKSKRNLK